MLTDIKVFYLLDFNAKNKMNLAGFRPLVHFLSES